MRSRVPPSDSERSEAEVVQHSALPVFPVEHETRSDSEMSLVEQVTPVSHWSASPESDIPSAQPPSSFSFPPALSPRVVQTGLPEGLHLSPSVAPSTVAAAVSDSAEARDPTGHLGQSGLEDILESLTERLMAVIDCSRWPPSSRRSKEDTVDVTPLPEPSLNVAPVTAAPSATPSVSVTPTLGI